MGGLVVGHPFEVTSFGHPLVNIEKANWKMTIYSGVLICFNGDLMGFNGF